jgi:hypothetical protein
MNPYRPRLDTSSVVICLATCQSWDARRIKVQVNCKVAHTATEKRKVSLDVIRQRSPGRGHEGEMLLGSEERGIIEKTIVAFSDAVYEEWMSGRTFICEVIKEADADDECSDKQKKLTVIFVTDCKKS